MTTEEFVSSLKGLHPPGEISDLLRAVWYDGKDEWEKAHDIAQDISSAEGYWIHAYLHRKEGDSSNAAYWYHRAGKPVPRTSLQEEWKQIATALLKGDERG